MNQSLKRGKGLLIFLVIATFVSLLSPVVFVLAWQAMLDAHPSWVVYTLTTIAALRPLSILAILFWSRTGVVAYVLLSATAIPVSMAAGQNLSILGIVGAAILLLLVRKHWR